MIGQEKLLTQFNNFTLSTLPQSMMFIGESGCGKHLFCQYIADKFELQLTDITEHIELELIEEIYNTGTLRLLVIDVSCITIKDQNIILKLLEEPPAGVFIALLCNSTLGVLATIQNRCKKFYFEIYTNEQLLQITGQESNFTTEAMLNIVHTPGLFQKLLNCNFENIFLYAKNVVEKVEQAPFYRIFNITNQIAFKNEQNKFDPELFALIILSYAEDTYKRNYELRYSIICEATQQLLRDIVASKTTHYDIKCLYDNYLINLKMKLDEVKA